MINAVVCWVLLCVLAYFFAEKQVGHIYHFNDRAVVVVGSVVHWVIGASLLSIGLNLSFWNWACYVGAYAFVILLLRVRDPLTRKSLETPKRVFFRASEIDVVVLGFFHLLVMRFVV